jgi:hypothetical protein
MWIVPLSFWQSQSMGNIIITLSFIKFMHNKFIFPAFAEC